MMSTGAGMAASHSGSIGRAPAGSTASSVSRSPAVEVLPLQPLPPPQTQSSLQASQAQPPPTDQPPLQTSCPYSTGQPVAPAGAAAAPAGTRRHHIETPT